MGTRHMEISVVALIGVVVGVWAVSCGQPPLETSPEVVASKPQSTSVERGEHIVYVPAYSHVTSANRRRVGLLTTLAIHNVSAKGRIALRSVEYHAPHGDHVTSYLATVRSLAPFETAEFVVDNSDIGSDIGYNFIVSYDMDGTTTAPLVEAVMVGHSGTGVIAVTSRGVAVEDHVE